MTDHPPEIISEPEWDRQLVWMVLVSGGVHLVAFVVLLLLPHSFLHHPPAMLSYSVDLVAPDKLGGSNVVEGGRGRAEKAPLAAAPPPPAAPPAPKVEPPPPPPKAEEPKPEVKPEPPKPEPPKVAKPEPPKPEPPKVEEKPKDEMALAEKQKVEPPPAPTVAQPAPTVAKPAPTVAKPPPTVAKAPPPQAKPVPPKVVAKPAPAKPPPPPPAPKVDAQAAKAAAVAKERDERIAAAIKHVEQSGIRGGGTGTKPGAPPGGPISVGPGEGAGGTVRGVEYLLYYNQIINTVRQRWAWAGNQGLEAVVRFNITDSGDVLNVRITHSSGDRSYDASVERAVRAVNPLPPPPETYRKEFSDVELTFNPTMQQ